MVKADKKAQKMHEKNKFLRPIFSLPKTEVVVQGKGKCESFYYNNETNHIVLLNFKLSIK
jgi:hypothetical protein